MMVEDREGESRRVSRRAKAYLLLELDVGDGSLLFVQAVFITSYSVSTRGASKLCPSSTVYAP